ncbi:MAG: hypothetical protein HGB12_13590 [Bacteroidetes bacterium]|nr:hypothetical protein [Bacteroidota bacterium]
MKKCFAIFLIITSIISCNKKDSEIRLPSFQTPIVTGYQMRDIVGNFMCNVGNPNIKLGNNSNDYSTSEYYMSCYPNPVHESGIFSIYIKTPTDSILKQIWVTPATNDGEENANSNTDLTLLFAGGCPIFELETYLNHIYVPMVKSSVHDSLGTPINGVSYPSGFYRVYVKVNNILLWDNIYLSNNL